MQIIQSVTNFADHLMIFHPFLDYSNYILGEKTLNLTKSDHKLKQRKSEQHLRHHIRRRHKGRATGTAPGRHRVFERREVPPP